MKKIIFFLLLLLMPLCVVAQSSMSDSQVQAFVMKEHDAGTPPSQIVMKLMKKGVPMSQIKRLRDKVERERKGQALGAVSDKGDDKTNARMRKNNAKQENGRVHERVQDITQQKKEKDLKPGDEEFQMMQEDVSAILPTDTATLLKQLLEEKYRNQKKVFGRDIFNNKELNFEPNMNIATPQDYRLGPGDAVVVDIYGASQKTFNETVSPDGEITIEGFGPVQVGGMTVAQANAKLRGTLGARYASSKVKLTVGQTKTIMVNVMGEVKAPGTYTLSAFATVFHALYMAGGINDLGTLRNIKVYRHNRLISTVDIYDYILNGKLTGNIKLADNDVIIVGPYQCLVDIRGKVKRPMYYEMKNTESVGTLLKYAGGFTGDAYRKSVRLVRKTGREYSVFNIGEFEMNGFHLADGDSISVDSVLNRYTNTVEVKGAVFRPGLYQLGNEINSVRTLIEHAEGCKEDAFYNRAVIHRLKPDRTLEVISVDLGGIMQHTVADVPLKENDVLFVPTKQEAQIQRTITVFGEVRYPGKYRFADNETLEDLILQAGGLTEAASVVKVDVARRISNPKALTTDSVIAKTYSFALKDGFVVDGQPGFILAPFDQVYVRRSPAYTVQQNVETVGQVMFPGTYTLSSKNERLSDLVKRSGGITDLAYVSGARLERKMTSDELLRKKTLLELAARSAGKDSVDVKKLDLGDIYYVGIELSEALKNPGGDADLVLREGDRLIVPEYNGTVKVSGDVMYPNTITYEKGKSIAYYIDQAGGWGNRAMKSHTIIIYMNGTVAKLGHGAKVRPGCEIVVPSKPKRNGSSLAQWLSVGTSVASIATMVVTMANMLKK